MENINQKGINDMKEITIKKSHNTAFAIFFVIYASSFPFIKRNPINETATIMIKSTQEDADA